MMTEKHTSVTCDSRKVSAGSLFVAIGGHSGDGHDYIGKALENGATGIIYDNEAKAAPFMISAPEGIRWTKVENARKALAEAADEFYGHPSRKLKLVGITGTNGKTTTVTLLYNLFKGMGYRCGLLSTIANYVDDTRYETANTTSDPLTINALMAEMVRQGCECCFMEVSSIGIEQDRVHALDFNVGIFSNITHDHLDYHKTFAEYLRCKKAFFDNLPAEAVAITNADDRNGLLMLQNTRAAKMSYSCRKMADHRCKLLEQSFDGMLLKLDGTELWCPLIGRHNAYNVLAIYSAALALGADREKVLLGLSSIGQVKGRLEVMKGPDNTNLVIDYAHTPDALENILETLRKTAPDSKLTCLFGCGGDRDRTKRPEMGSVAVKLADKVILTSDNSRTEATSDIINDIKSGIDRSDLKKVLCIEDRREAIRTAIMTATEGETILLAGKGHEDYQITDGRTRHFDEREVIREIIGN